MTWLLTSTSSLNVKKNRAKQNQRVFNDSLPMSWRWWTSKKFVWSLFSYDIVILFMFTSNDIYRRRISNHLLLKWIEILYFVRQITQIECLKVVSQMMWHCDSQWYTYLFKYFGWQHINNRIGKQTNQLCVFWSARVCVSK